MSNELKPCSKCNGCGLASGLQGHQVYCECVRGLLKFELDRYATRHITAEDVPEMVRKTIAAKALRSFANKYAIALEEDDYDSGFNQALNQADFEAVLLEKEI